MRKPAVYMMASKRNGTIYAGVTSDLIRRVTEHRTGAVEGFSRRYGCKTLVWFDMADTMEAAIGREKQIKAGSRARNIALIEAANPQWRDLYPTITGQVGTNGASA
ncbi:MAG: GIY-YIG nuclease family protein [Methylobacterium mesophilicum]|nr:GIY-YIG nuclease family protein [Methylobacterium mesophilicum]